MKDNKTVFIIVGPTASGKSSYALELAREHNGVIINADSMQLYDALPTLTAQPTKADREKIDHRLYGILDPSGKCSAWRWRDMALEEIRICQDEGKAPIIAGGTGFYLKALTEGLSPLPEVPDDVRAAATHLQAEAGNPAFHKLLATRDPEMASRLHPNDTQRLIRAWEVLEATGKSLSWWQGQPLVGPPEDLTFEKYFLSPPRAVLHQRCDQRFEMMIESGALEEVRELSTLISSGAVKNDAPITGALGFKPLSAWLEGEISREEAIEQAKAHTRQYAKRQVTWLRNQITDAKPVEIPPSQQG